MAVDPISRTFGSMLVAMVTPFTTQGEARYLGQHVQLPHVQHIKRAY